MTNSNSTKITIPTCTEAERFQGFKESYLTIVQAFIDNGYEYHKDDTHNSDLVKQIGDTVVTITIDDVDNNDMVILYSLENETSCEDSLLHISLLNDNNELVPLNELYEEASNISDGVIWDIVKEFEDGCEDGYGEYCEEDEEY